jgi:rhodanese-related sulfurtransferase
VRFIVLSRETVEMAQSWLLNANIAPDKVIMVPDLIGLGFSLTPTLIVVDQRGTVTDVLIGRLSSDEEASLTTRLKLPHNSTRLDNSYAARDIGELEFAKLAQSAGQTRFMVLDVRERNLFTSDWHAAVNIPLDELTVRAELELPKDHSIVIDCVNYALNRCRNAGRLLRKAGFGDVMVLKH